MQSSEVLLQISDDQADGMIAPRKGWGGKLRPDKEGCRPDSNQFLSVFLAFFHIPLFSFGPETAHLKCLKWDAEPRPNLDVLIRKIGVRPQKLTF